MNRQTEQQVIPRLTVSSRKIMDERRERGMCEQCGARPFVTEYAGNGWLICLTCCEARRNDHG